MKSISLQVLLSVFLATSALASSADRFFSIHSGSAYTGQSTLGNPSKCGVYFGTQGSSSKVYFSWTVSADEVKAQPHVAQSFSLNSWIGNNESSPLQQWSVSQGGRWTRECRYTGDCVEIETVLQFDSEMKLQEVAQSEDGVLVHQCIF